MVVKPLHFKISPFPRNNFSPNCYSESVEKKPNKSRRVSTQGLNTTPRELCIILDMELCTYTSVVKGRLLYAVTCDPIRESLAEVICMCAPTRAGFPTTCGNDVG